MIDLLPEYLDEVKSILRKFVSGCEIRVFGSRVTAKATRYSDLDIAICSDQAIEQRHIWKLEEEFSDSDLPFRIDIIVWQNINARFQEKITECYEIIEI